MKSPDNFSTFLLGLLLILPCVADAQVHWIPTNGPPGGAISTVCIDSNSRLFIGTEAGGVFESSNEGNKWFARNAGLHTFHMHELEANPRGYIFAVTYDNGVSRWFRDDQPHWTFLDTTINFGAIYSLSCAPSGSVFLGTATYGILRSTDNGNTWDHPDTGIDPKDKQITLVIASNGGLIALGSHLDSSRHSVYHVYNSPDDGGHWSILAPVPSSAQPTAFLALDTNTIFVGDADGKLFRTTNKGVTWQLVYQDTGKFGIYNVVESPQDHHLFLRNNYGDLYRSLDTGLSWQLRSVDTIGGSIYATAIGNNGTMIVGTDFEGVVRSTDEGQHFEAVNNELAATLVYNLAVDKRGMLYAVVEDLVWRTPDRGQTWTRLNIETGEVLSVPALSVDSSNGLYLGILDGVWVSHDSGITWSHTLSSPVPKVDNQCYQIETSTAGTVFAATQYGLFQSTDHGQSWQPDTFGLPKTKAEAVIVGGDGSVYAEDGSEQLYRSSNDGFSWSKIGSSAGITAETSSGIFFELTRLLSRSQDSGQHWQSLSVPDANTSRTLFSVYLDSHGYLYASTDSGIYRSNDNGDTWSSISNGFQDPTASRLSSATRVCEDRRNGIFYAASRGQGVFLGLRDASVLRNNEQATRPALSNAPNPFATQTNISFTLPEPGVVALELRNTMGEIVWSQPLNYLEAGTHTVSIEPVGLASGNYICIVRGGNSTFSKWITLVH